MVFSDNAKEILEARYLREGETWEQLCERVGNCMGQFEDESILWSDKFSEVIYSREFIPGGRILRNAGRPRGNLANCFNVPMHDNINSIGEFIRDALILWKHGGGVGTFIDLRPSGAPLRTYGGNSSGAVSFLRGIDAIAATIESGGQRRAAALGLMDISHPEIFSYLDAKLQTGNATVLSEETSNAVKRFEEYIYSTNPSPGTIKDWILILSELTKKLSHFNLSVAVNQEFLEAVERGNGWTLHYNNVDYRNIEARELWHEIISRMVKCGEPGLINWTNFIKNNSYYFAPITGTNACSELCLEDYGICFLGSIVLPRFVAQTNTNWKRMEEVLRIAVRFMDDAIDANHYVLPVIEEAAKNARRIGIGIMGVADYFFQKEIRYGSEKSLDELARILTFVRNVVYDESVKLAREKGVFPKFDSVSYGKASFIRKMPHELRHDIKKHGTRNNTLMALAPNGTTSLIADVIGCVETLFAYAYKRVDNVSTRYYIHPTYVQYLQGEIEELPDWFVDAHTVTPSEHLAVLATAVNRVDSNVSKTINLPKGTTSEEVEELLLEYIWDLKGVTIYVDESRDEQVMYPLSEKEARDIINTQTDYKLVPDYQCLKSGACEI